MQAHPQTLPRQRARRRGEMTLGELATFLRTAEMRRGTKRPLLFEHLAEHHGCTSNELIAARLGIGMATISRLDNGTRPGPAVITSAATVYPDVPLSRYFVFGIEAA